MNTYTGSLNPKLPDTGTTIFTIRSRIAAENHTINLYRDFPDYSPRNPTGSLINETDIKNPEHITINKDILLLNYEVYEHIVIIPLSPFDNGKRSANLLRVSFVRRDKVLKEAAYILSTI